MRLTFAICLHLEKTLYSWFAIQLNLFGLSYINILIRCFNYDILIYATTDIDVNLRNFYVECIS